MFLTAVKRMSSLKFLIVSWCNHAQFAHFYNKPSLILITHRTIYILPMNLIIEQKNKNIKALI